MRALGGIWIDRSARLTVQDQLARQIRELIQRGALAPGEPLPSTRDLAAGLRVSRNTAVYAYDRLISEGYLESVPRSGIFVSASITLPRLPRRSAEVATAPSPSATPLPATPALAAPRPFRPCQPDVALFPLLTWNRMRGRALRRDGRNLLSYQSSCVAGLPALRAGVAAYLRDHRGVRCEAHQVVITSGSQQALFLLATLLLGSRDQVWVEDPGYVEARLACQNAGARVLAGPIDDQGLTLPPSGTRVALVYTTPSRQFPTGVSLSLPRRLALIDLAARTRTWIVEDDYDSELRYGAPPVPSLQSLDTSDSVIYIGTFSKLLFPSLRLGYVVVPESLLERFVALKHLNDDHLPLLDQATLALFLESGAFYSHIRRCRREYATRQELFLQLFAKARLPLEFTSTDGGMNLVGLLPEGFDDAACSRRLREAGFDVPALADYALEASRPGLVFGFTAFPPGMIRSAFERMAPILQNALVTATRGRRATKPRERR